MPSNVSDSSANNTAERISVGLGCVSGAEYVNQTYQSFCSSQWPVNGDPRYVEYRITLTGTGVSLHVTRLLRRLSLLTISIIARRKCRQGVVPVNLGQHQGRMQTYEQPCRARELRRHSEGHRNPL